MYEYNVDINTQVGLDLVASQWKPSRPQRNNLTIIWILHSDLPVINKYYLYFSKKRVKG